MQDIYHSMYLLWRCPWSPSCLEVAAGPGWEVAQGSSQGTSLETIQEVKQELTVKVAPILITNVCSPSLWANPKIEG